MHASVHDLEAESLMCALGRLVVDPRVRGDLRAALRTRPVLGCADEGPTDPATLMLRLDVPALDEAHWLAPVAAVRMGAESDLDEACDLPVHLGHETTSGIELGGLPARIARAPSRRRRS